MELKLIFFLLFPLTCPLSTALLFIHPLSYILTFVYIYASVCKNQAHALHPTLQARCEAYGSSASYYCLRGADMDVCLTVDETRAKTMDVPEDVCAETE